ncbi:MAG: TIGR02996 domain-containing protein [Kofleriaceae bacterium]
MQIDVALASWRERRDPTLGDRIVSLGVPDPAIADALDKLAPTQLINALVEELSMPERAAKRMGSLVTHIDRALRTTRGARTIIDLLAEVPPDPRVGRLATQLLSDFDKLPDTTLTLRRGLIVVVDKHGDPSCIETLRALLPKVEGDIHRRVEIVATRLAKAKPLTVGELAALDGQTIATEQGEALLAAVHADPNSDTAREIYADHLIAAGDPRGEFIHLQLQRAAGTATDAWMKRERALLDKHWKAWLGPLRRSLSHRSRTEPKIEPYELRVPGTDHMGVTTFARGFLYRIHALVPWKRRDAILNDPMLTTIRVAQYVPKLTPAMRGLVSIGEGTSEMLGARAWDQFAFPLGDRPSPEQLRVCRVRELSLWDPDPDAVRANPHIEKLVVLTSQIRWDLRTRDWGTVKTLELRNMTASFSIDLANDHVDIYPFKPTDLHIAMSGFGKPFASAHVHADSDVVLAVAKEVAIAKTIYGGAGNGAGGG